MEGKKEKKNLPYIRGKYNPLYGDNRICTCGHSYVRHFDPFEDMDAVGCKYCICNQFTPMDGDKSPLDNDIVMQTEENQKVNRDETRDESSKVSVDFSFTDEFGNITHMEKKYPEPPSEEALDMYFLLEEFKCFLLCAGFSPNSVDKIQVCEDEM